MPVSRSGRSLRFASDFTVADQFKKFFKTDAEFPYIAGFWASCGSHLSSASALSRVPAVENASSVNGEQDCSGLPFRDLGKLRDFCSAFGFLYQRFSSLLGDEASPF
jgi:hypothetical protein